MQGTIKAIFETSDISSLLTNIEMMIPLSLAGASLAGCMGVKLPLHSTFSWHRAVKHIIPLLSCCQLSRDMGGGQPHKI